MSVAKPALSTRAIKPGAGARALYLGSRERKRVTCTDEALVVTNQRAQTMRYPVARVARVVSSADVVDWSGAALALCMRAGIGITWLDAKGEAVGTLYPQQRQTTSFATALELMLERADGPERYQNWLRARRMDVLMRWGREHADTITPQQWESTKREWVYARRFTCHLGAGLRALCLAYVGAQLAGCGVAPVLWGLTTLGTSLDEDLCQLLWAEMNLTSGTLADKAEADAAITTLFERWSSVNASALTLHLASLHRMAMKEMHT
ncbi:CRISPR-associated endonuclease Cas1 [Rhodoferax sp.]|uniref:CRISPR-associated endonuclease Cas1 n=1 Tax=Rhodoferax sp. TaxID=50421 RepID=UPI00275C894A|nr:CRISPR-associated endonuclease Cas1 [Rhodoferax sp.]